MRLFPQQASVPLRDVRAFVRRYFARRAVEPGELQSIMVKHIYTGAMGSIWGTLIGGLFFTYFGARVGLSPYHWGILGGVASWVGTAEVLSGLATQRIKRRKRFWLACALLNRALYFVGIVAALWLYSTGRSESAAVLIAAVALAGFFGAMANTPWLSWMADIIPEHVQGEFWGRRTFWLAIAVSVVSIPAGWVMDRVPEPWKMHVVMAVFVFATAIGLLDLLIHGTIPEPPRTKAPERHVLREALDPFRDRAFRPWLLFTFTWGFGMSFGMILVNVYALENLRLKDHFLGGLIAFSLVGFIASILTAEWSGRLVDRLGAKRVMVWSYLVWMIIPFLWALATPGSALFWVSLSMAVAGVVCTSGANAGMKILIRFPPAEQRAMYIGCSNAVYCMANGLGAFLTAVVMRYAGEPTFHLGGWAIGIYQVLFICAGVIRLVALALFMRRIPDER